MVKASKDRNTHKEISILLEKNFIGTSFANFIDTHIPNTVEALGVHHANSSIDWF